jgi:Rod binding domain-containing protein
MAAALALDPTLAANALGAAKAGAPKGGRGDLRAQAQDFEAAFLSTMFQQMYSGLEGDGPMGNSTGVGVWRSFLTDEYSKSFAKKGGIGLADHVHRSLLALQEAKTS